MEQSFEEIKIPASTIRKAIKHFQFKPGKDGVEAFQIFFNKQMKIFIEKSILIAKEDNGKVIKAKHIQKLEQDLSIIK